MEAHTRYQRDHEENLKSDISDPIQGMVVQCSEHIITEVIFGNEDTSEHKHRISIGDFKIELE